MDCSPPGSFVRGIFQARNTGVGCHFLLRGNLPNPGIEPMSPSAPTLTSGLFTTEPLGKPVAQAKNLGSILDIFISYPVTNPSVTLVG